MSKPARLVLVALLLGMAWFWPGPRPASANTVDFVLSPYWGPAITQWQDLIGYYAGVRGLDPDLVAAIIWEESHGRAGQVSAAGAVGLMQIMPREAGFNWRPPRADLVNPAINLYWGTRTFSQILQQAEGSLNRALAAYNGGWEQEHLRGPQIYTAKVLDHYARALAARSGYGTRSMKAWTMVLRVQSSAGLSRLMVLKPDGQVEYDAQLSLARLPDTTPYAVAYAAIDADNTAWLLEAWVVVEPIEGRAPAGHGTY